MSALATAAGPPSASEARQQAREILAGRRYRGSPVPQPFHRPLVWLGRELARISHWFSGWLHIPTWAFWLLVGCLAAGAFLFFVLRYVQRGRGLHIEHRGGGLAAGAADDDPSTLERQADAAERAGDLDGALRLRFRAGLLRLARARVIPARSSVTTREVRRELRSSDFDELARSFDEVVYGRRRARPDDLERARAAWPRVVGAAKAR